MRPSRRGERPSSEARRGTVGTTMPYPAASRKTAAQASRRGPLSTPLLRPPAKNSS
jgi:hypothetical protein